ncbi:MAG: YfhO family protein, partial [Elusimicrobiota bacterium]|nr:YfhO family protein [Elusimicrobiota bacterium]
FFWKKMFFSGLMPADGNTLLSVYPDWRLGKNFFSGALPPLWNPFRNLGEPFLADPQTAILYPLTWLTFLGGWSAYFKVWTAAHTLLAGVSAYLLAKRLFGDREAAFTAGMLAAFNGMMIARSSIPGHFAALSWLPAAAYLFISGRTVLLALSLTAQWFAGYPPFSLITLAALVMLLPLTEKPAESALRLGKAYLIFFCLAAVQLLPFLEMLKGSSRGLLVDSAAAFAYSIPPDELLKELFVPFWYGFFPLSEGDPAMVNFYFGLAVPAAALLIFFRKREKARLYVLAVLAFAFTLCLGGKNPLYAFPLLKVFRYPANWLALAALFAPLAAAAGFSAVKSPVWKRSLALVVALELLVYAQFRHKLWVEPAFFSDRPAVLAGCPAGKGIFHSPALREKMEKGFQLGNAGDALLLRETAYPSYATAFGFGELGSYQVLTSRRARAYAARVEAAGPGSPLLDYASIGAVITLKTDLSGKVIPEPAVLTNPDAKPFCFLEPPGGKIEIEEKRPGRLKAGVELAAPAVFVLSQAAYPGWRLKVDGKNSPPGIFEDFFLSVPLQPGRHTVELHYVPLSFMAGLLISGLAAALLLWAGVSRKKRGPRAP